MKTLSLLAAILALGFTMVTVDVQAAKRLGGGKSSGMQRQATSPDRAPSATPQAPAASKTPAAGTPQAQPDRSWMGPLAGLAAGLGLAALASHFGFGEELASMLMLGLLAMAVMAAIAFFMRRRAAATGAPPLRFATAGAGETPANRSPFELSIPASGSSGPVPSTGNTPPDFDVAGFERNAKVNFIRLQAANDAGNLDDIRDFTTPEMFAEIRVNISERGTAQQETDVVTLNANVVDVAEEENRYVVSVRFSGQICEGKEAAPEPIDEIWHMIKPRDGKTGWVLAGIQQMQ